MCGVREAICRRVEPAIDLVLEGVRGHWGVLVKEGARAPDG